MRTHSDEYQVYMQSDEWQERRELALAKAGYCCERCGYDGPLDVHHLTYERLGHEMPQDLEALCRACHMVADEERARRTQIAMFGKRLNGWAVKVYGEYWHRHMDIDVVAQEFTEWLRRKAA